MSTSGFLKRLALFTTLALVSVTAGSAACVLRDSAALLAFKAGIVDSANQLESWNETHDCCTFKGVICNPSGEVTHLLVENDADDDCDDDCPTLQSKPGVENLVGQTLSKLSALIYLNITSVYIPDALPIGLSALKKLKVLEFVGCQFHGTIPDDLANVTTLEYLRIVGSSDITGPLPDSFCKLTNLATLDISESSFTPKRLTELPACIGSLQNLKDVNLEYTGLTSTFPASLLKLQKLESLKLTGNQLKGSIPAFGAGVWPCIRVLYLHGTELFGVIPESIGNLLQLRDLRLGANSDSSGLDDITSELSGYLPSSLGNLKELEVLWVRGAEITGPIPVSLGQLLHLTDLELDSNELTGPIPDSLTYTNLTILALNDNLLAGSIPANLGDLKNLNSINLGRNQLSGIIPESLSKLTLQLFDASWNDLTGSIPKDLGNALSYADLDLSHNYLTGTLYKDNLFNLRVISLSNNLLTGLEAGSYPDDGSSSNVQTFDVHSNKLEGAVPSWVFQLNLASVMDLSDNKLTTLPTDIDGSSLLWSYLNLSSNAISGPIPAVFANVEGLNVIDLSRNNFSGSIPENFTTNQMFANIINFGENTLTGSIPESIFASSFLNVLILNKNRLTGTIPPRTVSDFLNYVDLSDNLLTGPIPKSLLDGGPFITKVKLDNNKLSGEIPDFSGACNGNLDTLTFTNNKLTGPVVPKAVDLKQCQTLTVYDVGYNQLTGTIPWASLINLKSLLVLGLGGNNLTGTISTVLANSLHSLVILDLSMNQLQGSVPWSSFSSGFKSMQISGNTSTYSTRDTIYTSSIYFEQQSSYITNYGYTFTSTSALILSKNSFTGTLTSAIGIGLLKGLHLLDVSFNKFSGALPAEIGTIPDLNYVDFSNNNFTGQIPTTFAKFPPGAFSDNPMLCGLPLNNPCK